MCIRDRVYCADCGSKMQYGSSNNRDFSQDFFDCSLHKKNGSKCKGHFIRVKVLGGRVLSHVQRVTDYILCHEDYFRKMCIRDRYQIDLLNGSKERVSEAEYWVRRRGQLKLDRENAALTADGQLPRQKKFETVKDTLRKQISSVLYRTCLLYTSRPSELVWMHFI